MIDFGLHKHDINQIINAIAKYPEINEALIFGSRAKGTFKNGSDIDIALKGTKLNFQLITSLNIFLNEETTLPYTVDILNFDSINNTELTEHINRVGISIYNRKKNKKSFTTRQTSL